MQFSLQTDQLLDEFSNLAKEKKIPVKFYLPRKRYTKFEIDKSGKFSLKYDSRDYLFIPGLRRHWNNGALTPVFFDLNILNFYLNDSDYTVRQLSFSRVSIYKKDEALLSNGFGINRRRKLFTWLKDFHEAFSDGINSADFLRFLSVNIESDHDIASDFYRGQIEIEFTKSDNERRVFEEKNLFDELVKNEHGIELCLLDIEDMQENFQSPVKNNKSQIFASYLSLNKLLVENINKSNLKHILIKTGIAEEKIDNLGSLKLLEKFLFSILDISDASTIISPLFVLYDLRKLEGHLHRETTFKKEYDDCKKRLNQQLDISDIEFYKVIINSLIQMYSDLIDRIATST